MRETVPGHERLQDETVAATGTNAQRVLELGTGTGQTAQRVLARHPAALLVGVDASSEILGHARAVLPSERIDLRVGRLEDRLGPFDVVVSVLAVHRLDAEGKARLFRRVADILEPGGRFVIGDFVVPTDPSEVVSDLDPEYDTLIVSGFHQNTGPQLSGAGCWSFLAEGLGPDRGPDRRRGLHAVGSRRSLPGAARPVDRTAARHRRLVGQTPGVRPRRRLARWRVQRWALG